MKQILSFIAAASIIGGSAFAQTTVESCNRTVTFDCTTKTCNFKRCKSY